MKYTVVFFLYCFLQHVFICSVNLFAPYLDKRMSVKHSFGGMYNSFHRITVSINSMFEKCNKCTYLMELAYLYIFTSPPPTISYYFFITRSHSGLKNSYSLILIIFLLFWSLNYHHLSYSCKRNYVVLNILGQIQFIQLFSLHVHLFS